ncbi:hypothetical protein GOODEAATRI_019973, partial [Goodea atripinnis]
VMGRLQKSLDERQGTPWTGRWFMKHDEVLAGWISKRLRLLPAEPCPGFTSEDLPHSLLAASKPLSYMTCRSSVSYQTGKYLNEFTATQGSPRIHLCRTRVTRENCLQQVFRLYMWAPSNKYWPSPQP